MSSLCLNQCCPSSLMHVCNIKSRWNKNTYAVRWQTLWYQGNQQGTTLPSSLNYVLVNTMLLLYPPNNKVVGGYIGFTLSVLLSVCPSVCPSLRPSVCLSRLPCPLCNIYSSGWILSILATNDHYHKRVCGTQWPLTLIYIFKVIWPWLRKSCPLCSIYSSGWILFIFGTNDHYH